MQTVIAGKDIARLVAASVIGGTASGLSGGKLGNGAANAAFAYLYHELSLKEAETSEQPLFSRAISSIKNFFQGEQGQDQQI